MTATVHLHAWQMDIEDAVPGVAPVGDDTPGERLECDGEVFELRPDDCNGTHYTWLSGPNAGYGFSVSPTTGDLEQHRSNIRGFLSMIDPAPATSDPLGW